MVIRAFVLLSGQVIRISVCVGSHTHSDRIVMSTMSTVNATMGCEQAKNNNENIR